LMTNDKDKASNAPSNRPRMDGGGFGWEVEIAPGSVRRLAGRRLPVLVTLSGWVGGGSHLPLGVVHRLYRSSPGVTEFYPVVGFRHPDEAEPAPAGPIRPVSSLLVAEARLSVKRAWTAFGPGYFAALSVRRLLASITPETLKPLLGDAKGELTIEIELREGPAGAARRIPVRVKRSGVLDRRFETACATELYGFGYAAHSHLPILVVQEKGGARRPVGFFPLLALMDHLALQDGMGREIVDCLIVFEDFNLWVPAVTLPSDEVEELAAITQAELIPPTAEKNDIWDGLPPDASPL